MKELLLYKIVRPLIKLFMRFFYRIEVIDSKNIPETGGCILAGNHTNNFDCLLLISSTKRQVRFMAKKELIDGHLGLIFKSMGIIPVDRSRKNEEAKEEAIEVLNEGGIVGIFPEGTINRTKDTIMPFKYGTVSIASKTSSPVIPFIITGKYKLFKKSIKIKYLKPYNLETDDLETENNKLMEIIRSELEND